MPTVAILQSHPLSVLKKEISKTNIKGYSKMKKDEVIALMMKPQHKDRFHHIVMAKKKERAKPKPKAKAKAETHKMPDGKIMSGKTHSAKSKDVKLKPLTKADMTDIRKSVPKKDTYTEDMKPLLKEQKELLKLLDDNKDKLKKIDTFKIGIRGKVKDGNFYDENRLSVSSQILYGTPKEAKKRLDFYSKKIKKELGKAPKKPRIVDELNADLTTHNKELEKSYKKNKPKLDKMTATKYRNSIKRQNNKFLDGVKEIFEDYRVRLDVSDLKKADKFFYELIPDEQPKAKAKPKANFKNELYNILNKYYELLNKIELKVLNKKIKDESIEYNEALKEAEDIINEKLFKLLKKYKIDLHGLDDTTEFFERSRLQRSKPLDDLNNDNINYKQIPNYKKFRNTSDKIEKANKIKK